MIKQSENKNKYPMGDTANNPFRQVALTLISLTIIVLGIVYNQATEKSEAEVTTPMMDTGTQQTTPTPTPQPSTIVPIAPKIVPIMPSLDELDLGLGQFKISPTIDLATALENLTISLDTIRQFAASPREIVFASDGLELGLPGIGLPSVAVVLEVAPVVTPPTTEGTITTSINPPLWKILTGYNQLERFTNTISAIQKRNAGTGKCMIDITGIGCLVNW